MNTISEMYRIETDGTDWPKGLSNEEKGALIEHVKEALGHRPMAIYDLYRTVTQLARGDKRCAVFNRACLSDWLYGCIVRAARAASAEQRWHLT